MNQGPNPPSGQAGGKGRRRRRGRRGPVCTGRSSATTWTNRPNQPGKNRPHGRKSGPRQRGQNQMGGGIYTAPMDHSYRALQGNNNGNIRAGRGGG